MAPKGLYKVLGPREQERIECLVEKGLLIKVKSQHKRDGYFYTQRLTNAELMVEAVELLLRDLKANANERKDLA